MENTVRTRLVQVRAEYSTNAKSIKINKNLPQSRQSQPYINPMNSQRTEKLAPPQSSQSRRRVLPAASAAIPKATTVKLTPEEREENARIRIETNNNFKAHLETLPLLDYPKCYTVSVIADTDQANERIHQLIEANKTQPFFGVDLEWPPQFVKGKPENKTTLVQICSDKEILLFQIARMRSFPIELRRFFEEETIQKSGVNIHADGLKLQRDFGFITNGLVELREMSDGYITWPHNLRSLRALTGMFLAQNMPKGKVRMSNWGKAQLTDKQVKYAALDAYASYQIFMKLKHLRGVKPYNVRHMNSASNQTAASQPHRKVPSNFPTSTVTILHKAPRREDST
ncbi:ribonuclease H-like domain-containing protein [Choanephora cucurbitarum]|nr:ribonuclease H-like domain-containing protein [Choanephora cucurbitarum]